MFQKRLTMRNPIGTPCDFLILNSVYLLKSPFAETSTMLNPFETRYHFHILNSVEIECPEKRDHAQSHWNSI